MVGHIALAAAARAARASASAWCWSPSAAAGVKANATSLVGTLYDEDDQRRDAGFSIFYMGINLGALVGPLLTGLLQTTVGFHAGFGLAAVGMAIGLIQYTIGRKQPAASGARGAQPAAPPSDRRGSRSALAAVVVIAVLSPDRGAHRDQLVDHRGRRSPSSRPSPTSR